MSHASPFTGCKAFIHADKSETILADTTVLNYDAERMIITIQGDYPGLQEDSKVSILILQKSGIYEFKGTIRKTTYSGDREIALFKGRVKEDRQATRYPVNAPGKIDKFIIGEKVINLSTPIDITIINISANGIMIHTTSNLFNIGNTFQLFMNINGNITQLKACVKRSRPISMQEFEYGCVLTGKA